MNEIILRGYAKVSDRIPVDPAKHNKICVVLDCSSKYVGRSINRASGWT